MYTHTQHTKYVNQYATKLQPVKRMLADQRDRDLKLESFVCLLGRHHHLTATKKQRQRRSTTVAVSRASQVSCSSGQRGSQSFVRRGLPQRNPDGRCLNARKYMYVHQSIVQGPRAKTPRLPLTASPSVWLKSFPRSKPAFLQSTPLLRCDGRSRYVRPHTTPPLQIPPALAWTSLTPHASNARRRGPACCSRIILLAACGVFQVFLDLYHNRKAAPWGQHGSKTARQPWELPAGKQTHSLKLQLRARAATAMLAGHLPHIAICEIADPHPLQHGEKATGPSRSAVLLRIVPFCFRMRSTSDSSLWARFVSSRPFCSSAYCTQRNATQVHVTADVEMV